jgi:UDP-N-acetylmuramoyl-tripeptide--D-alanyl-D-alanine ligase
VQRYVLWLATAAAVGCWGSFVGRLLLRALHALQLDGYYSGRYLRWSVARRSRWLPAPVIGAIGFLGVGAVGSLVRDRRVIAAWSAIGAALGLALWRLARPEPSKKPLVLTARARRLLCAQSVLSLALALLPAAVLRRAPIGLALGLGAVLVPLLVPVTTAVANVLLWPVEASLRRYYLFDARRRLRRVTPTVIAVAGSYGKTSTKEFVATVLAHRFSVLRPPGSQNTPMGISRVLRERLESSHEVFVAELGDYKRGEIADLCRLVGPRIGVLTAIGPEHLDRFGSMENVVAAKRELIEALPPDGLLVANVDDPLVRGLADAAEREGRRVTRVGLEDGAAIRAIDVRATRRGLAFRAEIAGRGGIDVEVGLLGRHNVTNLLAAVAVGLEMGMEPAAIADALRSIEPVEHRLQPIERDGILVIDDAYNSNPRGAAEALRVLGELEGGRKLLVTPGMIELADREFDENRRFGYQAASVCDEVILVGPERARPILAGLADAGYPADRTHVVRDLGEATRRLGNLVGPGDVVLFENDLTDLFDDGRHAPNGSISPNGAVVPDPDRRGVDVDGLRISVRERGSGGTPVVILHGWGASIEAVGSIQSCLEHKRRTIAIDLPGFGQSDAPPDEWGSYDYAEEVRRALEILGIERVVLIGHSFGGQVASIIAARHAALVERMVLVDSAGVRRPPTLRQRSRVLAYKAAARSVGLAGSVVGVDGQTTRGWLANRFGSADYRAAGPLRRVLVRVLGEDIRHLLPSIQAPTLLIWGDRDSDTPLADGQEMERLIPDAGLVVFPGAGHYAYADAHDRFCRVVDNFLS